MTRRIVIRPKASVDLDEQFAYIADSNFDAALSFFDATRQTFSQLARLPGIGSVYNVKNPRLVGLRKWGVRGFEKHLIFYLEGDEYIEIVRLIHKTSRYAGNERVFRSEREATRAVLTALNLVSLPPWSWEIRGTFVMYFQRDNYRFKFLNSVRIMFCSKEPPISGVMLASTSYKSLLDLQHCSCYLRTV